METKRLILRPYREDDLDGFYEYVSNPRVVEFEPYKPMTRDEAGTNLACRITSQEFVAVEEKCSGKLIGNVYLGKRDFNSIEIGYVFNEKYWRQGYAAESCKALISDLFSKGIHRIFAECDPQNVGSWKLLESLGFRREGHLKQNVYFWTDEQEKPVWKDTYIYALLNSSTFLA